MNVRDAHSGGSADEASEIVTKQVLMISLVRLSVLGHELKVKKGQVRLSPANGRSTSPLVTIRARGSGGRLPLFLIHPVGGSVIAYYELAKHLRQEQSVYAIENQIVFDPSLALYSSIEEMARRYLAEIQAMRPKGPYVFGGYSMGGLVAFEMARQASQLGHAVAGVLIIDTPVRVREFADIEAGEITTGEMMTMARMMASRADRELGLSEPDLESLPPAQRLDHVVAALREQQILPAHVDSPLLHKLLKVVKSNEEAQRKYVPLPYDGKLVVFRASDPSLELRSEAGAICDDPTFGWQSVCRQQVTVHELPGEHLRIMNPPHVAALANAMQRCLDQMPPEPTIVPY